jgi:ketosteroid isomerase-like protein
MTEEVAYRFIEALAVLEQQGDIEPIVDTFAEACEIGNSLQPDKLHGKTGALEYWNNYRSTFRDIRSTFRHIITGDTSIALEWTTKATDRSGKEFHYDGVSVLDIAGGEITRFRAYFDTRKLGEKIPAQADRSAGQTSVMASSASR